MTLRCPHRHVSYTTWRLRVFQRLFAVDQSHHFPIDSAQRRGFATKRVDIDVPGDVDRSNQTSEKPQSSSSDNVLIRKIVRDFKEDGIISKPARQPQRKDKTEELMDMIADLEHMVKNSYESNSVKKVGSERSRMEELALSPLERRLQSRKTTPKQAANKSTSDYRLVTNAWANMLASPMRLCQASKARLPRALMMTWGIMQHPTNQLDYLLPVELSDVKRLEKKMLNDKEDWMDLWRDKQKRKLKAADRDFKPRTVDGVEDIVVPKYTEGSRIYIQPDRRLTDAMTGVFTKTNPKSGDLTTNSSALSGIMIPFHWRQKIDMAAAFDRTGKDTNLVTGDTISTEDNEESIADFQKLQWQHDIGLRTQVIMAERIMISLEGIARRPNRRSPLWTRKVIAMDLPANGKMKIINNRAFVEEMVEIGEDLSVQIGREAKESHDQRPAQEDSTKLKDAMSAFLAIDPLDPAVTTSQGEQTLLYTSKQNIADTEFSTPTMMMESLRRDSGRTKPLFWPYGSIILHIGSPSQYRARIEQWHTTNPSNVPHHPLVPPTVSVNDSFNIPIFNLLTLMGPSVADRLEAITHGYTAFDYGFWADLIQNIDDKQSLNTILEEAAARMSDPIRADTFDGSNSTDFKSNSKFLQDEEQNQDEIENENEDNPAEEQEARKQGFIKLKYKDDTDDPKAHMEREYMVLIKGSMYQAPELIMEIWRLWRYIGGRNGIWLGDLNADRGGGGDGGGGGGGLNEDFIDETEELEAEEMKMEGGNRGYLDAKLEIDEDEIEIEDDEHEDELEDKYDDNNPKW